MLNSRERFRALIRQISFPSPFVFAFVLTILVFILSSLIEKTPLLDIIVFWGDGLFDLLKFSAQMALILICGSVLAKTKLISVLLDKILIFTANQTQAVMTVTIISILGCYFNWGFGLVLSAIVVNKLSSKMEKVNFAQLVASAYSGFLVWHGGLSGSIPLKLTESGVSLNDSLFSVFNLRILLAVIIAVLFINFIFSKVKPDGILTIEVKQKKYNHHNSSVISKIAIGLFAFISVVYLFAYFSKGFDLILNTMIFIFLTLGLILSGGLDRYSEMFKESVSSSYGILLQFPFYAGLMSVMAKSGLALTISQFFIDISSADTFLINTYLSAGILNFFVPSGGGQWVIQGPIILSAAKVIGIDEIQAAMTIAWGDAWSNMIQPFWALPILSIAHAKLKDIFLHCFVLFIGVGTVTMGVIYFS
jgi:short-chain fatty acids transporter